MPHSTFVRPKITKFFEEAYLERVENGSFWFGTLKRYRSIEKQKGETNVESRFSDTREGVVEHAINFAGNGYAKNVRIGRLHLSNCSFSGCGVAVQLTHEINDFAFCASYGPYSLKQHIAIKEGMVSKDGSYYEGNHKLTHYAEIDLMEFLEAIQASAPKSPDWNTSLPMSESMLSGRIAYGDPKKHVTLASEFETDGIQLTGDDYLRTVFLKPDRFSPENEFRVVLRPSAPASIEGNPQGMPLKHKRLKRAIKKIGFVK